MDRNTNFYSKLQIISNAKIGWLFNFFVISEFFFWTNGGKSRLMDCESP
jgi:hypothetical protein